MSGATRFKFMAFCQSSHCNRKCERKKKHDTITGIKQLEQGKMGNYCTKKNVDMGSNINPSGLLVWQCQWNLVSALKGLILISFYYYLSQLISWPKDRACISFKCICTQSVTRNPDHLHPRKCSKFCSFILLYGFGSLGLECYQQSPDHPKHTQRDLIPRL